MAASFSVAHPDAGQPRHAPRLDAVVGRHANQHLLEIADVAMHVAAIGLQVDDRVADDLAGAVVGDVAAAPGLVDLDRRARPAPRRGARMCDRPPSPRTPSVRTCGCSTSSSRSPTRPARRSSTSVALQRQRLGVRDAARAGGLSSIAHGDVRPDARIPVLERVLHVRHELVGDRAVDEAVVVAERQVRHRPDRDRVVDDDGPLLDGADAENRDLRLVDDRHAEQRAEHAGVRDRERAAGHLVGLELLACARAPRGRRRRGSGRAGSSRRRS